MSEQPRTIIRRGVLGNADGVVCTPALWRVGVLPVYEIYVRFSDNMEHAVAWNIDFATESVMNNLLYGLPVMVIKETGLLEWDNEAATLNV